MSVYTGTQNLPGIYNPVLGKDYATNELLQRMQKRRQERLMTQLVPQIQPKSGMLKQFVYGTTDPVTKLAAKFNLIGKREDIKAQGFGENVARFLGNLLGYGATVGKLINPLIGSLSAGVVSALGALAAPPLVAGVVKGAVTGSIVGGVSAWMDDRSIGKGMTSGAVWGGATSVIGAGARKVWDRVRQQIKDPVDQMIMHSVTAPKTAEEIDMVLHMLKNVPEHMKQSMYKDSITNILAASQPGGALDQMTPAQAAYFQQQAQQPVTDITKAVNVLFRVLRQYPDGEQFVQNIMDTTGQAQYGSLLKARGFLGSMVKSAMYRMSPANVPASPTVTSTPTLPADPWIQSAKGAFAENMPISEVDRLDFSPKVVAGTQNIPAGTTAVPQAKWDALKQDILTNGFKEPLVVGFDSATKRIKLTDGSIRLAIAKEIGLTDIPVRIEQVSGITGRIGNRLLRSALTVAPTATDLLPSQVYPAHRITSGGVAAGVTLSKKASAALDAARNAKTLNDQFASAEDFYGEVRGAYKGFLKSKGYRTLEALINDPNAKQVTIDAAQRHMVRRDMAQELLWNIKGQFDQGVQGMTMKDLPSMILSKAFGAAPGATSVERRWHHDLMKVLQDANAKLGKSYPDYESMLDAAKKGEKEVLPFLKQWKTVEHALKQKGEARLYGMYSFTLVPLPDDIDQQIATRQATIPTPSPIMAQPATTPEQQQALADAQADFAAKLKANQEFDIFDFISERIDAHEFAPITLEEELILRHTKPFGLFSRLIPIRFLFGKAISNSMREATVRRMGFNEQYLGFRTGMGKWMDYLKPKNKRFTGAERAAAGKRIGDFLEDETVNQKALAKMVNYDDDNPIWQKYSAWVEQKYGMNPKELRVASWMRDAFNTIFKQAGLDDKQFIEAYYPHFRMIDDSLIKKIESTLANKVDPTKLQKHVNWINKLTRTGNLAVYEEDAFKAFSRYINGAGKHIAYDDLFKVWTKAINDIDMDESRKVLFSQLQDSLLGRPTEIEAQIDEGIKYIAKGLGFPLKPGARPTQAVTSFLAEMQNLGGIGGNPFAVAKNLTQKILFLPQVVDDPDNWMDGIPKWHKYRTHEYKASIDQMNPLVYNRQFAEGLTYGNTAMSTVARIIGAPETGAKRFNDAVFAGYKWADMDNVKDAFGTQFVNMIDKGASMQDAFEIATATAMNTQFMYGLDSPMLYKTALGRAVGVFMSWPLNWAMMLYNQGNEGNIRQAIATVGAMAVGSAALSLTGFNFMSTHPVAAARGILPVAMLEGQEEWPSTLRTGSALLQQLRALANGDQTEIDKAFENLKRRLEPMVPLGVGVSRIVRFVDTVKNDWKQYDLRNRYRREVPVSEAFRSILGPTVEADQRYHDYLMVQGMESDYRRLRAQAIEAYFNKDVKKFKRLQEHLMLNYGQGFITPADIRQELSLRSASAIERQLVGLPEAVRNQFMAQRGYEPTAPPQQTRRRLF